MTINLDDMDNGQLLVLRGEIDQKLKDDIKEIPDITETDGWDDFMGIVRKTFFSQTISLEIPVEVEVQLSTFPGMSLGSIEHDFWVSDGCEEEEISRNINIHNNMKSQLASIKLSSDKLKKNIVKFADKNSLDKEEVWNCIQEHFD